MRSVEVSESQRQPAATSKKRKRTGRDDPNPTPSKVGVVDVDSVDTDTPSPLTFNKLPEEMIEIILCKAASGSREDAYNVRAMCKLWKRISGPKLTFFGGVLKDDTIQLISSLHPSIPLKTLTLTRLNTNEIEEVALGHRYNRGNHLQSVQFSPSLVSRSVEHLVIGGDAGAFLEIDAEEEPPFSLSTGFAEDRKLRKEVESSMDGADLTNILAQLKDVKTVTLGSIAFSSVSDRYMSKLHSSHPFSTITKLDIIIGEKTDESKIIHFLRQTECPQLLCLYIRVYADCLSLSLFISYYQFIAKHPHLKKLSISQAEGSYKVQPRKRSRICSLNISAYPNIRRDLMIIQLDALSLDMVIPDDPVTDEWKELERDFLRNQTSLRSLELQICVGSLDRRVDELLPHCQDSLERLEVSALNGIVDHEFDCSGISNFRSLSDCSIGIWNSFDCGQNKGNMVGISNINMLPSCITTLQLQDFPGMNEFYDLKNRLVNLQQISYTFSNSIKDWPTILYFLFEHFKIRKLTEFRVYDCAVSSDLLADLNDLKGVYCSAQDETMVVCVDRDEFENEHRFMFE